MFFIDLNLRNRLDSCRDRPRRRICWLCCKCAKDHIPRSAQGDSEAKNVGLTRKKKPTEQPRDARAPGKPAWNIAQNRLITAPLRPIVREAPITVTGCFFASTLAFKFSTR